MTPPLRVAILGAESSGKSTLAQALAERHGTLWVPEYLREFVDTRQRVPVSDDQFFIASMQVRREDAAAALARGYLFCDTTPLMTAVYSNHYFGGMDRELAALTAMRRYDMTIVTAPDSPWVADGLMRDSDQVRQSIHRQLLDELRARQIAWLEVGGSLEQRLARVEAHLPPLRA
ncbi:AAA family ATPase [Duganella callida]|uniref:Nicotinamide-nucleotide adenylyltransferase n=1 Tax=Duganella callida TaxID=2561932 RepID=A0A4Y9S9M9_9BURK|nr:ATP-binding protein [Duganella callida]TFW18490.1 nicotinamide-nucleotide adenylyltransferase [Duganella callida]